MKFIKLYEELQSNNKIGNYVIANSLYASNRLQNFFKNNIGKIINSKGWGIDADQYCVEYEYDDIDNYIYVNGNIILDKNSYWFAVDEIISESDNKEDLILILKTKKYNL